jgi:carbamoylphosphate synthase large subunit
LAADRPDHRHAAFEGSYLEMHGVRLLGTNAEAIDKAEDSTF